MFVGQGVSWTSKRSLGSTGLEVTALGFGAAEIGSMVDTFGYGVPEERALETIHAVLAGPINFIDTAAAYGDGESERRIGSVLRERGGLPKEFVLSTKADRDLTTGEYTGEQIKRSVERSVRLLGSDRLQLVFLHDPEHTTYAAAMAPGGPVDVLQRLQRDGAIAHLGVAGGPIDMLIGYIETGSFEAVITHNRYTLLNRSAEPLIERACQLGIAVLNAAPYGSGLLAKGPDAYPRYAYSDAPADLIERARSMHAICADYDVPLAAAALQFSLRDRRVVSTIVGMSRPERLQQTVELASLRVPDELWARLDALAGPPVDPETVRWQR
jgi:D-threo-aldose 1-dehydrogenase